MKKKQLNRRQRWRIKKMQEAYAQRAAKKQAVVADSLGNTSLGKERTGLVISNFGQQFDIEALEGKDQGQVYRCYQRSNLDPLVAGDYVIWQEGDPVGVVIAGLPRKNILERQSGFGQLRPVAANIDNMIVVVAPLPEPHANLIDRYLVAAEHYRIHPLIVLNKADLLDESNENDLLELLHIYKAIGYHTLMVSTRTKTGMTELADKLNNKTSVFVGQSGVGKSALINTLLPGINTLVGELSDTGAKGKHTTTAARLFHFPEGGDLIDSPGIREFSLEHIDRETLLAGFREFSPYLGHCKFRDCRHQNEPGCNLLKAVRNHQINPKRMVSFRHILSTLDK